MLLVTITIPNNKKMQQIQFKHKESVGDLAAGTYQKVV